MAQHGQADGYYDTRNTYQEYQPPQGAPPVGYQGTEPQGYVGGPGYQGGPPQQGYGQQYHTPQPGPEPKYSQQPPTYGEAFSAPQNSEQEFKNTFKIPKPKWNDLWAGLLVSKAQS